ncbi:hypothetical protein [Hymenobacter convexus]|uniref:hypothetical protein n=1 Tax=Hymenobacter sp. CA1UV-4 TaxID=3063782 RepID=UPI002713ED67|nr:hypothetical protein [Hymenobacter sp. CA1UV-4]MDO7851598.1 hypothetical protein [Hymenobacter sp. CA1UV-4]
MIKQQGDKIVNLAADITEHGLSAAERFMVVVPENRKFPYISIDGNRRLVALKLLHEPLLAEGTMSGKTLTRLKKLADDFAEDPIDEVELAVFDSREHGALWVARRHSVNMNGVGQDGWEAIDKQRFDAWRGFESREWQILEFVRKHGTLTPADIDNLNRVPITTLRRLVADGYIRTQLGLEYREGRLLTTAPNAEVIKPLQRMVVDLLHKHVDVTMLALSQDRKKYFDSLEEAAPFVEQASPLRVQPHHLGEKEKPLPPPVLDSDEDTAPAIQPIRKQPVRERRSVIPVDALLPSVPEYAMGMYQELQRADANTYPQACAALLRFLLEASFCHYLNQVPEADKRPATKKTASIPGKLQAVITHATAVGLLSVEQSETLSADIKKANFFASNVRTIPDCTPWPDMTPTGPILRKYWNSIQPLFQAIWL